MTSVTKRKMNKGNVLDCLKTALHHIDDHKVGLMEAADALNASTLEYRFRIMREELREVVARIQRIKEIAERDGLEEIITILNEEFEFGHDR